MKSLSRTKYLDSGVFVMAIIAMIATALYLPSRPFVDENAHWPQAQVFAQGGWAVDPGISTWPTMNAAVGWTLRLFHEGTSITAGRLVIVAFSFIAIAGFFALAKIFNPASARLRSAQFFLSPVVLPFCALIYTDLPALSCLLWAAIGAYSRKFWLLLVAGALACALRQNDIIWDAALCCVFIWRTWQASEQVKLREWIAMLLVAAAWLTVVVLTGGVAGVGTRMDHPGGFDGIPNIWFALAVAGIVYLPYFLSQLLRHGGSIRLWQMLALGLLVALTFHVTHRYNLLDTTYFVRNDLLRAAAFGKGMGVFVVVVTTMALLVARSHFAEAAAALRIPLLLISMLSLLPFWLIEQRYYLPIYAFFWALRAPADRRLEYAQLLFGGAGTVWMVVRIAQGVNFV